MLLESPLNTIYKYPCISVKIPSNLRHQWSIEYSAESVDIMRSYTLSQGYDKYEKAPSLHLILLYLSLSCSNSLCAIFVPYLCTRNKPHTPLIAHLLTPHSSSLTRSSLTTHPLTTHLPINSSLNVKTSHLSHEPLTVTLSTLPSASAQCYPTIRSSLNAKSLFM